ncbi:MAG: hypothetical protein ACRC8Y_02160 [Chroococcales cyanobacterium]
MKRSPPTGRDESRCFRHAVTTKVVTTNIGYESWDGVHVCSNDFSRC